MCRASSQGCSLSTRSLPLRYPSHRSGIMVEVIGALIRSDLQCQNVQHYSPWPEVKLTRTVGSH